MTPEDENLDTGPSWITLFTGLSKEHHGITDSWGSPSKFRAFPHPCIWDVLNKNDLSVGLFSLPVTYPPKAIREFWVSGFPTPTPKTKFNEDGCIISFPTGLQEKYLNEHIVDILQVGRWEKGSLEDWGHPGGGKIGGNWQSVFYRRMKGNEEYPYDLCDAVYANQFSTIKKLFTDMPVDAAFIQFSFIDHIAHLLPICPETRETLREKMYPRVNAIIKDLWQFLNPENMVIVSDHGFKGDKKYAKPLATGYRTPHTKEAVACFYGPNIIENHKAEISNMDIMPTILFILDLAAPKTDGRVHYELFKSQHLSKEDEEEITRKLRALGYIT